MELKDLEEIVENMILQHAYPGYDSRTLNLSLPVIAAEAPVKLYLQALTSKNTYVQLTALRWFQKKPGAAKHHFLSIIGLMSNFDPWVRKEAIKTLEITKITTPDLLLEISSLLKDKDEIVRIEAARALGNLAKGLSPKSNDTKTIKASNLKIDSIKEKIIIALKSATEDPDQDVRRKALKALRKLGAYSTH